MNWIQHPAILEGKKVKLIPLENSHFKDLVVIGRQEQIWAHMSMNGTDEDRLMQHLKSAVLKRTIGEQYPLRL